MNALKSEVEPSKIIDEDHPKVREIILTLKEEYSSRLQMEKDKGK